MNPLKINHQTDQSPEEIIFNHSSSDSSSSSDSPLADCSTSMQIVVAINCSLASITGATLPFC
ncbi:Conserved hypothetical protein [Prochlorococcus marinus str. MIT 9313]|uniref:Uncharacterized protein n=1 Tax=Prochlorococcus marinus (strain MIT 9313) TaxID=74547 RepID=B9ES28_PROMM|nr:Conserved hypothetical protein [Prochlorococcus marinus str. MIT 9313]